MSETEKPSAAVPQPAPQPPPPPSPPTEPVAWFDRGAGSTAQPIPIMTKTERPTK